MTLHGSRGVVTPTTLAWQPCEPTGSVSDRDGKISTVAVDGTVMATPYDQITQLTSVAYAGGAALGGISRDVAGRGPGHLLLEWSPPDRQCLRFGESLDSCSLQLA